MKDSSELEINTSLTRIAKSSMVVFIGIFLSKLITYVYRIVIARHFGPEIYGIFSLAFIVLGFFTAFSTGGLIDGLGRFLSFYRGKKQQDKIKYLFKKITIILMISCTISGILLFLSSKFISVTIFHNETMTIFLKAFSILIPLTILTHIFLTSIRSFEKVGWYSFIWNILQNVVKLSVLMVLIFFGVKENAIIFSYILGVLSMLIVSYFVCRYSVKEIFGLSNLKKESKIEITKEVFSYSWPFMFSGIITTIFYWTDSSLIGYFMNPTEVGLYNAAYPLMSLITLIPVMFSQLFFPLITKYFSQKKYSLIKEVSKQVGKWIFIFGLPILIILILFPGAIINLFFGKEYIAAQNVLRILAIGGMFSAFTFLLTDIMSMAGKSKLIFFNILITSIINVFLDIILIKRYGIEGAAIATTSVLIIWTLALFIEVKHYVHFVPLRKKMIRIFLVSLIPTAILLIIKQLVPINALSLILLGIFFILFYFLLVSLTSLDKNDFFIIKMIKGKFSPSSGL